MAKNRVFVIGVGMTKFERPGKRNEFDYPDMARESLAKALIDANICYNEIEKAFVGYCFGDSTSGQRALYAIGMSGIPIVNVNNNCSTGSTALYLAKTSIESGETNAVLALGFEKMASGSLGSAWTDRTNPLEPHLSAISAKHELDFKKPMAPTIFGLAGMEYCEEKGLKDISLQKKLLTQIAWKNHKHSTQNPYSQFRQEYSPEQIENSRSVFGPLTMLQCCPTSDGSACAILASEKFVRHYKLESQAVEISAMVMRTDRSNAFGNFFDAYGKGQAVDPETVNFQEVAGKGMTEVAAKIAFSQAGISPKDIRVVELHDCFSANELITYEALGLTSNAIEMVRSYQKIPGSNLISAKSSSNQEIVINPSGGLISKGHPLGATGLAQCAELTWQLRGWCGSRQVKEPNDQPLKYALQHNIGLGGAVVVAIYRRPEGFVKPFLRLGYNPAQEVREVTNEMIEKVRGNSIKANL